MTACLHITESVPINYGLNSTDKGLVALSLVNNFENFDPEKVNREEGLSHWQTVDVKYQKVGDADAKLFKVGGALISPNGGLTSGSVSQYLSNPYGLLIVTELDPGKYEIGGPNTAAPFYMYYPPSRKAHFTVEKGKITYIGEYGISISMKKDSSTQKSSYVSDGRKRDIEQLFKLYPSFKAGDVIYNIQPMEKQVLKGKILPPPSQSFYIYVPAVAH